MSALARLRALFAPRPPTLATDILAAYRLGRQDGMDDMRERAIHAVEDVARMAWSDHVRFGTSLRGLLPIIDKVPPEGKMRDMAREAVRGQVERLADEYAPIGEHPTALMDERLKAIVAKRLSDRETAPPSAPAVDAPKPA